MSRMNPTPLLLLFGLVVLGLAGVSVVDMFLPRPWDGVELVADSDTLTVSAVVAGSGADLAGIRPGDEILGIGREAIDDRREARIQLNKLRVGQQVPYLVRTTEGVEELDVRLTRRRIGTGTYLYTCVLGLSFFLVGLFVLIRQPALRASQIFFLLCGLFMLFLVCRLRPASYSGIDTLVLEIGTLASLALPAAFLHFYLIFPRPAWIENQQQAANRSTQPVKRLGAWLLDRGWVVLYTLPFAVFAGVWMLDRVRDTTSSRLAGAPMANWWLMVLYLVLGLLALRANARYFDQPRERHGMALVLIGSVFGLVPFLIAFVAFQGAPALLKWAIVPLLLVPVTFTYAIVRFQLLDIRIILRRSLLYTLTSVVVTAVYAFAIAAFNAMFRDSDLAASGYFPIVLALAIVLLFEPLRRRIQQPIDRFFFADRSRLRQATVELGEALTAQVDPQQVVQELVEKLPKLVGLHFAALYLLRGDHLARVAGPASLPASLPVLSELQRFLQRRSLTRLDRLGALPIRSGEVASVVRTLGSKGVEAIGDLASSRRWIGLVLLSAKQGQIPLEREELQLLQGLLNQAALALETGLLLEERTHRAELDRELHIAASIQSDLLPEQLHFAEGWSVEAMCRPARDIGGDFYAQLPDTNGEETAVIFADVSGKSVSGALMMMATHEALHALAIAEPEPGRLFDLTNRRLYRLGRRRFVALGYLAASDDGCSLRYLIAGQPPLLLRRTDGSVRELPLPDYRIPVGALPRGRYQTLEVALEPGDVVLGFSDGITEATSPEGEFFGDLRLQEALATTGSTPEAAVHGVRKAIDDFTRGGSQYDDLTLVAVGRRLETAS